jgi:leucyl aminopeptidase (aminopeptidase T)
MSPERPVQRLVLQRPRAVRQRPLRYPSSTLGGTTRAPVHFDAVMAAPTLELDGEVVLEDGEFTVS